MGAVLGVSASTVMRHWQANGLKPHIVRGSKVSRDPKFVEKLEDIVGLYMSPPEHVYKSRWQVELFFKWIKQHLRIKKFLGNSENAVKTQIWCAIATYVLIAIVKKELHLKASLYTCLQILSISVFEKTQISCALRGDDYDVGPLSPSNQLILFNF